MYSAVLGDKTNHQYDQQKRQKIPQSWWFYNHHYKNLLVLNLSWEITNFVRRFNRVNSRNQLKYYQHIIQLWSATLPIIPEDMLSQTLLALCDIDQIHLCGNTCNGRMHPSLLCTSGEGPSACTVEYMGSKLLRLLYVATNWLKQA